LVKLVNEPGVKLVQETDEPVDHFDVVDDAIIDVQFRLSALLLHRIVRKVR